MPSDIGLDSRILEHTVAGFVDGAVLEHEVLGIAEQLLASQVTIHQSDVLRVPRQILAIEHRVVDGDVLALPERVLCQDVLDSTNVDSIAHEQLVNLERSVINPGPE